MAETEQETLEPTEITLTFTHVDYPHVHLHFGNKRFYLLMYQFLVAGLGGGLGVP